MIIRRMFLEYFGKGSINDILSVQTGHPEIFKNAKKHL
jgi:hypothetical protein